LNLLINTVVVLCTTLEGVIACSTITVYYCEVMWRTEPVDYLTRELYQYFNYAHAIKSHIYKYKREKSTVSKMLRKVNLST